MIIMNKNLLLVFFLLLLASFAFAAVSNQDAIDFVSREKGFLQSGETAEISPNVKISSEGNAYWLVAIVSGDSLSGFVPVSAGKLEIPASKNLRSELIKTAYFLREFDKIKKFASQQGQWIFSSLNAKNMNDLSTKLQSESSLDLTTVESELGSYPELQAEVQGLKDLLGEIYPKAGELASALLDVSSFENAFYNNPETSGLDELKAKFDSAFSQIEFLDSKKIGYLLGVDKLKQGIAKTSLSIDTKRSLGNLASAPQEIAFLSNISASSISLKESISRIFDDAVARSETFSGNLETRIKRNNAFVVLYGTDEEIIEKTQQKNLSDLVELVLSEDYAYYWKNQEEVAFLRENWQKAQTYYNNGSFETAMQFASKAKANALKIYEDGLEEQKPIINTDLIITAIVGIIVLLIIIVLIRNRKKFVSLVSNEKEDEKMGF